MMLNVAAVLPPVAVLVLAAGSFVFRRRRRSSGAKQNPIETEVVHGLVQSPTVHKPRSKQGRKKLKTLPQDQMELATSEAMQTEEKQNLENALTALKQLDIDLGSGELLSSSTTTKDNALGEVSEPWTTVKRKSRTSRTSAGRPETQPDLITAQEVVKPSSSSSVDVLPRQQSNSTSCALEASARAQAEWYTSNEVYIRSESLSSQPTSKGHPEHAQSPKEGHVKRRGSATHNHKTIASAGPTPLQKSQSGKTWAAVTANKKEGLEQTPAAEQHLHGVKNLAIHPLLNRSSEFGTVGDQMPPFHSVKAKVDTGNRSRSSSNTSQPDVSAKVSLEAIDSTFSSPRSLGSASPRSYASSVDGMSDEEQSGNCAAAELEYVARQNLTIPKDPVDDLKTLPQRLDSSDWLQVAEALNNLRALALFHPASTDSVMPSVAPQILKAMKNPRSALQKTAIMALADAFTSLGDKTLPWVGLLLLELFLKASQDKKFVCETADEALRILAAAVAPGPLLEKLLPFTAHKSQRVRAQAIAAGYRSLVRMNLDEIVSFGHERLLKAAKRLQTDKQPEAREAARKMLELLESGGKVAPITA